MRRSVVDEYGGERARRSRAARDRRARPTGSAPTRSKMSSARRSGSRASTRRRARRSVSPWASSVRARSKGRASPCSAIARRKWRSPRVGGGHAAGALEQALDPRQLDARGELLELVAQRGSASARRSRWMATSQASLARLAASAGCATARARPARPRSGRARSRAARPRARRSTRRASRPCSSRARSPRRRRSRSAPRLRAPRRCARHGPGCREDRRLARLARQTRALVGGRRGARQAARVVVGAARRHEEERQGRDHRRARARSAPAFASSRAVSRSSPSSRAAVTPYSISSGSSVRSAASLIARNSAGPSAESPAANAPKPMTARLIRRLVASPRLGEAARELAGRHQPARSPRETAGLRRLADEHVGGLRIDLRRLARRVHEQAVRIVERARCAA